MERITLQEAAQALRPWIVTTNVEVLNVARPRQSNDPEIYDTVFAGLPASLG